MGPLIPCFWTSSDVCPGFQSQDGFPHLHASSLECNGLLRFTSGATSTDLLAKMAELIGGAGVTFFFHLVSVFQ